MDTIVIEKNGFQVRKKDRHYDAYFCSFDGVDGAQIRVFTFV